MFRLNSSTNGHEDGVLQTRQPPVADPFDGRRPFISAPVWLDDGDEQPLLPPPALWPEYTQVEDDNGADAHEPQPPREVIVQAHLLSTVPASIKRKLAAGRAVVVVIETASPDWTEALAQAARRLWHPHVVVGEKGKLNRSKTPLADGPIVALASELATLSQTIVAAADCTLAIRPDARAVALAIEIVCGGRTRVKASDVAGLEPDDLAFAIRRGMTPRACLIRLKRLTGHGGAAQIVETAANDRTPELDRLVGYGVALDEIRAAAADVELVKAGALAASELPSMLLYGPPGTGKTTLVRSFARSTGLKLVATSVSAWFHTGDGALGGVAKNYKKFFDEALAAAPCVAFLDELDALPDRATLNARGRDWWNPVLTGILLQIDKVRAAGTGVVLCAATNHLQHIDAALKRPGRFDRLIEILGPQTPEELAEVLRHHLKSDLAGADLVSLARLGHGATGATAEGWVRAARRTARGAGRPMVLADLAAAIAPQDDRLPAELRLAALHEAGHAVIGRSLGLKIPLVSIVGGDQSGGRTTIEGLGGVLSRAAMEARVIAILAGRATDETFSSGANSGAAMDLRQATEILVAIHGVMGLGERLASFGLDASGVQALALDGRLRVLVEDDLQRLMAEARRLVALHEPSIRALADLLLVQRVASTAEIDRVLAATRAKPTAAGTIPSVRDIHCDADLDASGPRSP